MLRPHFRALSISFTINAMCKHPNEGQDSLDAPSSVISINGKNLILPVWQPAGIDQIFIGKCDGGMRVFPELSNSSHVEGGIYKEERGTGVYDGLRGFMWFQWCLHRPRVPLALHHHPVFFSPQTLDPLEHPSFLMQSSC